MISTRRHYARAPIKEAVIEVRVVLPPEVRQEDLLAIERLIKQDYPVRADVFTVTVEGLPMAPKQPKKEHSGYQFVSADSLQVVTFAAESFTFSRLAPYGTWEAVRGEAARLWALYRELTQPIKITRVGVRYVNQIDILGPTIDFKDYFRTIPEVGPDIPQGLAGYVMQLHIPLPDVGSAGGMLVLNQALVPPPDPTLISIILDIDVFVEQSFSEDRQAWSLLEILRDRKNQAFEGSITDKTRELIS